MKFCSYFASFRAQKTNLQAHRKRMNPHELLDEKRPAKV